MKAATKNGPNGISSFLLAFFNIKRTIATIAPKMNDRNIQSGVYGKPNNNPMGTASLTSPKPIPRPFVSKLMDNKKNDAANAQTICK